jgi:multisubunit Na+/H+ antiporter MnhG subunit
MYEELRKRVDGLFSDAPKTARAMELKEELTANLIERYDDLIAAGKNEKEALEGAFSGIGDMDSLVKGLKEDIPVSEDEFRRERQKSALFISAGVGLYIVGVAVLILFSEVFRFNDVVGLILMLVIDAVATGLIVYNALSRPKYLSNKDKEDKEWQPVDTRTNDMLRQIKSILWLLIVVLYFLVSFMFGIWAFSWVIFIIGVAIEKIIVLMFQMKER